METVTEYPQYTKLYEQLHVLSVAKIYFNRYPDKLSSKTKLFDLITEQEKIFGKERGKIGSIKAKQRNKIYETITDENNHNRYLYNVESFIDMVENKIPLLPQQKAKLVAAFLLTQDGFAGKKRKTGGPAFSHILGVVKLILETENCDFDRVLKALLHDNIEDLTDFNLYEYKFLFNKKSPTPNELSRMDAILELSHKPWYHRIGFLPQQQKTILHNKILQFAGRDNVQEKTKEFSIQIGHNDPNNTYEGLESLWHVMDANDADILRKELQNDPETKDIMNFVMGVSDFRFFDKALSGDNLAIKFADRLQNTQKLFNNPIKSVLSLFETQYHFLEKEKSEDDKRNVQERMKKFPLKRNPKISHYDVLAQEVERQKDIAKKQCIEKLGNKESESFDFDTRYDKGYDLYIKKTQILESVDKNRSERIDPKNKDNQEKIIQLEQEITTFYKEYYKAEHEFSEYMNILES